MMTSILRKPQADRRHDDHELRGARGRRRAVAAYDYLTARKSLIHVTETIADALVCGAGTGTGTILLVEDRQDVRQVTRRILETRRYRVVDTGDAESALRAVEAGGIDLLLADVVMPDVTGPDLARRLCGLVPNLPVVFMSGFSDHSALNDMKGAPFIRKPFSPEGLAQKIREVMEQSCSSPHETGAA